VNPKKNRNSNNVTKWIGFFNHDFDDNGVLQSGNQAPPLQSSNLGLLNLLDALLSSLFRKKIVLERVCYDLCGH
jgi:hypothetical protein